MPIRKVSLKRCITRPDTKQMSLFAAIPRELRSCPGGNCINEIDQPMTRDTSAGVGRQLTADGPAAFDFDIGMFDVSLRADGHVFPRAHR
jgi:hypothetical protein